MSVEKETRGGVIVPKQKGTMTRLKVLLPGGSEEEMYDPGQYVYVKSEQFMAHWAKEVFDLQGLKFILIPETEVLLHEA